MHEYDSGADISPSIIAAALQFSGVRDDDVRRDNWQTCVSHPADKTDDEPEARGRRRGRGHATRSNGTPDGGRLSDMIEKRRSESATGCTEQTDALLCYETDKQPVLLRA